MCSYGRDCHARRRRSRNDIMGELKRGEASLLLRPCHCEERSDEAISRTVYYSCQWLMIRVLSAYLGSALSKELSGLEEQERLLRYACKDIAEK